MLYFILSKCLLISIVSLGIGISGSSGQFFNTRCNNNDQCNSYEFLQCLHGYCQCDSRSMVYDHSLKQCVIRPGGKCHNSVSSNFMKCAKNSVCIASICECQPGYSILSPQDSLCKPNYLNNCHTSRDCDVPKGLSCIEGSCQCRNASLTYQGFFGCVDARDPQFVEMMTTLKKTERLLQENNLDIDRVIDELDFDGSNQINQWDFTSTNQIQSRQLFGRPRNPNDNVDLTTSAQNQAPAQSQDPAGGLQGILQLVTSLGSIAQLLQPLTQLGQPGSSTPAPGAPGGNPSGGSPDRNFPMITNFLNIFNKIIPFFRRLKMMLNPFRFIQKLMMNFKMLFGKGGYPDPITTTPASTYGPPPSGGYGPPPGGDAPPPPPAQAVQNYNPNVQPIVPSSQSQQQDASFQNFQTQNGRNNQNYQNQATNTFQNQPNNNNFQNNGQNQQFNNNDGQNFQQNQKRQATTPSNPNQGFQQNNNNNNQNSFYPQQSNSNNNNNQQQQFGAYGSDILSATSNNRYKTINNIPVASAPQPPPQLKVSQNKYPRQERFSNSDPDDDDSPYLPEHL